MWVVYIQPDKLSVFGLFKEIAASLYGLCIILSVMLRSSMRISTDLCGPEVNEADLHRKCEYLKDWVRVNDVKMA